MAETAVGLFQDASTAKAVVDALHASAFPADGIRILSKPVALSVDSATSTPGLDFAAGLSEDLRSMGATDSESKAYLDGVRHGNTLVFATGSIAQADAAISIMNSYDPIEIEEFAGSAPALPSIHVGEITAHNISLKSDRARAKSDGAKIFTW